MNLTEELLLIVEHLLIISKADTTELRWLRDRLVYQLGVDGKRLPLSK